ncbi:MAG: hypothetical protein KAJ19_13155 [Gammaproteobacteria bacterium]|nr:hypothetical protein [Gammaproteobacteria bacterium]
MVKNLISKVKAAVSVGLIASTLLYSGCFKATTYDEKTREVITQIEQRERTGDYKTPVIQPQLKIIGF